MNENELIKYLESRKMESKIVEMLLFNDFGFYFSPVNNISLRIIHENDLEILSGEINILSSNYQLPTWRIPKLSTDTYKSLRTITEHSKYLYAYVARHNSRVFGEVFFERGEQGIRKVRNAAFKEFLYISGIESITQIHKQIQRSEDIRNNLRIETPRFPQCIIDSTELLFDESFCKSMKASCVPLYLYQGIDSADYAIYANRYISIGNSLYFNGDNVITSITYSCNFVDKPNISTDITKDISIVNSKDKISDILYDIALSIKANQFYVATGYAYKKGLDMLETAFTCVHHQKNHKTTLLIGDLQKYNELEKQKVLNMETAEKINWYIDSHIIHSLRAYPDCFYHGKYYYISNGNLSYVITGSSNVTESAYISNKELDIIFRFDETSEISPLAEEFRSWFSALISKSVELPRLKTELFSANNFYDNSHRKSVPTLVKNLTSEEELKRYQFLDGLSPSSIEEALFDHDRDFKAFKHYTVFKFLQHDKILLESFDYGNSCYVFGTSDIEKVKRDLFRKSKEQVKESMSYITDIPHNEMYETEINKYISTIRTSN